MDNDGLIMLSRVADSLYWTSRYLERAEHTARLIDVHLNLMLDITPGMEERQRVERLFESLNLNPDDNDVIDGDAALRWLTFAADNPYSIVSHMTAARENARQIREQISSEMWMQINTLYLHVKRADANSVWQALPHDYYLEVKEGSHLFQGVTDATMNHNQGWHFIQIGRYIERSLGLLRLLRVHFKDADLAAQVNIPTNRYFELVATLKSVSAFEAYCKVYNPNLQPSAIVEFLLFNREFPRSLRFCVEMFLVSLQSLGEATSKNKNARLHRLAGRLQSNLTFDEVDDIENLHEYLRHIERQIYQIHDTLYDTYIAYPIEIALK